MPTRAVLIAIAGLGASALMACGSSNGQQPDTPRTTASVESPAPTAAPSAQTAQTAQTNELLVTQALPDGLDADRVEILEVSYPPGAPATPAHRHPGAVFAYVVEGTVISQLEGQEPITYSEGQTWYEPPGTLHLLSRNASSSQPTKLVVFFIIPQGQPATVPVGR